MNSSFATKTGSRINAALFSLALLIFLTPVDSALAQEKVFIAPSAKSSATAARLEKATSSKKHSTMKRLSSRINVEEVEPNDDPETAQVLTGSSPITVNGTAETADIGALDIDYGGGLLDDLEDLYVLTISQPGLKINLSGNESDLDIFLFDGAVSEIIDNSNSTGLDGEEIDQSALPAGTYLVAVTIFDDDPIGPTTSPYVLTLIFGFGTTEPPANDECATAITVGPLPFTDSVNTTTAVVNPNDPVLACADGGGGKTVWYKFTPTNNTTVRVSTLGSTPDDYDTVLGVFTGSCGDLTEILCTDDLVSGEIRQADTTFSVIAGETYFIHVAEWNGGGPNGGVPTGGDLVFSVREVLPPTNDECAATRTVGPLPFVDEISTVLATVNPNDPALSCGDGGGGRTVWYEFTPAQDVYVKASTLGSTPEGYNTVLGVFTGACDALTEVKCRDDASSTFSNKAELSFAAEAGQTYTILVAEFGGVATGGNLVFSVIETEAPKLFQGPAAGSIPGGESISTDDFPIEGRVAGSQEFKEIPRQRIELIKNAKSEAPKFQGQRPHFVKDTAIEAAAEGAREIKFPQAVSQPNAPFPVSGFQGIDDQGNFIPPDPIMAAGPNHVMGCVNTDFAIFAKDGTLIEQIDATEWFENVLPGLGQAFGVAFDPQIVYDHFADRWVMLYIASNFETAHYYLISTSDDSDPTGTWYNFAVPGHLNGDTPDRGWGDYPKMAVDESAIYITANQFGFISGSLGVKLTVLGKAQFYNNTAGAISWTNFWDLRNPDSLEDRVSTVIPALTFGTPGTEFLINDSPYFIGAFMTLWSLTNPLSATPTLSAVNVSVDTSFGDPTPPQQLGGGFPLIESQGRTMFQAVYRDGSLWTSHNVPGGTDDAFAALRYVRINTTTAVATEDVAFGADNFWYFYPALMVDQNSNLTIVVNRSGLTEFPGIRYTGRLATDPLGLQPSSQLKAGESNYVKTFGGGRNRWGDYNGIALDPVDNNEVWMFAEYAETPVGPGEDGQRWGTWFGQTTFAPLTGSQISLDPEEIYFGEVGLGNSSASIPVSIRSIGNQNLTVTAISSPGDNYVLENVPSLPAVIAAGSSVEFSVRFAPTAFTQLADTIIVTSNDAETPTAIIALSGQVGAEIDLSTPSLATTIQAGDLSELSFTISNLGGSDLTYNIGGSGVGALNLPPGLVQARPNTKTEEHSSLTDKSLLPEVLRSGSVALPDAVQAMKEPHKYKKLKGIFGDFAPGSSFVPPNDPDRPFTASANTIFKYDVSNEAGEEVALGVEFDGANFWVTGAGARSESDPNRLFKYDLAGNLLATFDQPTTSEFGWRDLAFDGQFLYASDSENIDQIDPATGAVTGVTISGPLDPNRGLAYDPVTDHFWTANFASDIFEIDRSGSIINQYPNSLAAYGLAWDATSSGGPYLWIWSQDANGTLATRFTPSSGTFSAVTFEGDDAIGGIAGGATFTTALPTIPDGIGVLVSLHQSIPDVIAGYLTPPSWLTDIDPVLGTIAVGGASQVVNLRLDADGLTAGDYEAELIIGSNDDNEGRTKVPLSLTVTAPQGSQARLDPLSKNFGFIEVGASSAPSTFSVRSIGTQVLTVTDIASSTPAFTLADVPSLPLNIGPGTNATFTASFSPTTAGPVSGAITIISNDADAPALTITVSGIGVPVGRAKAGVLYASSGNSDGGRFFTIDPATGAATLVGSTGFGAVAGLAINSFGEVFGSTASAPSTLIKINAETGEALEVGSLGVDYIESLAFDADNVLYGTDATDNSGLYRINPITAQATEIGATGVDLISGLSFSPDGVLFASNGQGQGNGPGDQIYTINTTTAASTLVGDVGFDASIPDIAFDRNGNLLGMTGGQGPSPRSLISIDPTTGAGTLIGALGFNSMSGLCFAPGDPDAVEDGDQASSAPKAFVLEQNYPNPFNPSTKIRYAIAQNSHVVLKIYSVLGQEVRTVVDEKQTANAYETIWDGRNNTGVAMPSGVYFYQIRAGNHVATRRMLFLK